MPSVYIQAAIAMMLIQLVHKAVREIPGATGFMGEGVRGGGPVTIGFACLLAAGILLLLLRIKWGLLLGIIAGAWIVIQPVIVHLIPGRPDINGIWWYPIFPVTQGLLIVYFSILAWRRWHPGPAKS